MSAALRLPRPPSLPITLLPVSFPSKGCRGQRDGTIAKKTPTCTKALLFSRGLPDLCPMGVLFLSFGCAGGDAPAGLTTLLQTETRKPASSLRLPQPSAQELRGSGWSDERRRRRMRCWQGCPSTSLKWCLCPVAGCILRSRPSLGNPHFQFQGNRGREFLSQPCFEPGLALSPGAHGPSLSITCSAFSPRCRPLLCPHPFCVHGFRFSPLLPLSLLCLRKIVLHAKELLDSKEP